MTCAWKELIAVLPGWMRKDVDAIGAETLQELRIHINSPPELVCTEKSHWLERNITQEDIRYTINAASRYSPWTAASAAQGYITVAGGHRIGLCGETVVQRGRITGINKISSICIRIARDFRGIASGLAKISGSVLILGPPGWGKTTLLRDLIRQKRNSERIAVVDERSELFPDGLFGGYQIDVLSGCSKLEGIPMLLRTMGPSCIAVDEITDPEDVTALLRASNCGVRLLATAHAASLAEFRQRNVYRSLWENRVFDVFLVLRKDKSFTMERMTEWVTSGSVQY